MPEQIIEQSQNTTEPQLSPEPQSNGGNDANPVTVVTMVTVNPNPYPRKKRWWQLW